MAREQVYDGSVQEIVHTITLPRIVAHQMHRNMYDNSKRYTRVSAEPTEEDQLQALEQARAHLRRTLREWPHGKDLEGDKQQQPDGSWRMRFWFVDVDT